MINDREILSLFNQTQFYVLDAIEGTTLDHNVCSSLEFCDLLDEPLESRLLLRLQISSLYFLFYCRILRRICFKFSFKLFYSCIVCSRFLYLAINSFLSRALSFASSEELMNCCFKSDEEDLTIALLVDLVLLFLLRLNLAEMWSCQDDSQSFQLLLLFLYDVAMEYADLGSIAYQIQSTLEEREMLKRLFCRAVISAFPVYSSRLSCDCAILSLPPQKVTSKAFA